MQVTMFVVAVVGFPLSLLVGGAIREFKKNRAQNKPTLLDIHTVIGYRRAKHKGEVRYDKARTKYDMLKQWEKDHE